MSYIQCSIVLDECLWYNVAGYREARGSQCSRWLEYAVGVVLVVVVEARGQRVQRVPHEALDERGQRRLRAAHVEPRAERRHRATAAQARQLTAHAHEFHDVYDLVAMLARRDEPAQD